ncbi:unnamed protein product [Moneuplotes crassus]|uniref:Uncharacterized protein n=1 Tax=Euplotes crassus TaxID=5936 RepID=A0AAD1XW92_EUPCR|nr:unnamed protein product [Moneuplotes crassus]
MGSMCETSQIQISDDDLVDVMEKYEVRNAAKKKSHGIKLDLDVENKNHKDFMEYLIRTNSQLPELNFLSISTPDEGSLAQNFLQTCVHLPITEFELRNTSGSLGTNFSSFREILKRILPIVSKRIFLNNFAFSKEKNDLKEIILSSKNTKTLEFYRCRLNYTNLDFGKVKFKIKKLGLRLCGHRRIEDWSIKTGTEEYTMPHAMVYGISQSSMLKSLQQIDLRDNGMSSYAEVELKSIPKMENMKFIIF